MTLDDQSRQNLIGHRIKRAYDTVHQVEFLIQNNMTTIAVNRIYYGMFYALSALALEHQFITSKHGQLIGWFNKNFIKNNKLERKFGQFLRDAFDNRSRGDYDDWIEFSKDEVIMLFEEMKEFIREMDKLINEQKSA
jgi:uncharacterized protein (UPF0332 family)